MFELMPSPWVTIKLFLCCDPNFFHHMNSGWPTLWNSLACIRFSVGKKAKWNGFISETHPGYLRAVYGSETLKLGLMYKKMIKEHIPMLNLHR